MRTPMQPMLPLLPQAPAPAEIQAELVHLWKARPRWHARWGTLDALLSEPWRARALQACVRQLLLQRQAEWLRRQPTTQR